MNGIAVAVFGFLAVGAADERPSQSRTGSLAVQCGDLYSDEEARSLVEPAGKAVPKGRAFRRDGVLKALGIDPARLCNRRVLRINLGYIESWQMSPSFDFRWAGDVRSLTPPNRDNRRIYHVRVVPRASPLVDPPPVRD